MNPPVVLGFFLVFWLFFLHVFIGNMPVIIIYLIKICYIIDAFIIKYFYVFKL